MDLVRRGMGVEAPAAGDLNVLYHFLCLLGAAVDLEDYFLVLDLDIGDDAAIARLYGRTILGDLLGNRHFVGADDFHSLA